MFPVITHQDQLIPKISAFPEFGVYQNAANLPTVVCYAISDKDTFLGDNTEFKRECRGITFHPDGTVAARTMHKFFNVGENATCQPNQIPWDRIVRVGEKHDGSMITPFFMDGELSTKTKRSFDGPEATGSLRWLNTHEHIKHWCESVILSGFTPTFEWVSPDNPIVLTCYKESELILLQLRDMETGEYVDFTADEIPLPDGLRLAENRIDRFATDGKVTWESFADAIANDKASEGWVIQTADGDFWKIKTDFYRSVHHVVTFPRWRDFLYEHRHDRLDDIRANYMTLGRSVAILDFVEDYTRRSLEDLHTKHRELAEVIRASPLTGKDLHNEFFKNPMYTNARRCMEGKPIMEHLRKDWFREELPKWSLRVVPSTLWHEWNLTHEEAVLIATAAPD